MKVAHAHTQNTLNVTSPNLLQLRAEKRKQKTKRRSIKTPKRQRLICSEVGANAQFWNPSATIAKTAITFERRLALPSCWLWW